MEPDSDTDTEPMLNEFESVNIKQEDSLVPVCIVKSALKVSCHICVTEREEMK